MRVLVLILLAVAAPNPLFGPLDDKPNAPEPSAFEFPLDLPADAAAEVRRILDRRFRVTWTVLEYATLPEDVAAVLDGPILDAQDQETVRRSIRSGGLRLEHVATTSGMAGERLSVTAGERRVVVPMRDIDKAEGVVLVYPMTAAVRTGLRASVAFGVVAGRGVRVAYDLVLADVPVVETVDDTGGEVDRVAVREVRARGALRLAPGEVAPILLERKGDPGVLVLLRLDGPDEDLPVLIDLASGVTLAVGGHLVDGEIREPVWERSVDWRDDFTETSDETNWIDSPWEILLEAVGCPDEWWDLPEGLRAGRLEPAIRVALDRILETGATLRGRREVLEVVRAGRERIRLPLGPGEPFEATVGVRRCVRGETFVGAGCQDSSAATARTEVAQEGFGITGRAGVDGTVDFSLLARDVLGMEVRDLSLVRVVSGYRAVEKVPVRIPLVRDAILRVRGALPDGGGPLPGGVHLTWTAGVSPALSIPRGLWPEEINTEDAYLGGPVGGGGFLVPPRNARVLADSVRPVALEIAGSRLSMRPWTPAGLLVDVRRCSRVTAWRSEGWCGMRTRFPVPSHPTRWYRLDDDDRPTEPLEGTWLRLALGDGRHGLEIDIEGEIGGPPDAPVAFDPGDGPVEIVRSPRLRVTVRDLPLGGGGVVAQGAGLSLEVRRLGVEPGFGPHRHVVCRRPEGVTLLRTGAGGSIEAGGVTLLPTVIEEYRSNHATGGADTDFTREVDGVRIAWLEDEEPPTLMLEILEPPDWRGVPVKTVITPARPGDELRTLVIGGRRMRRSYVLEPGRGLKASSATGSPLTYEIEAGGDS
jgi:hypothetical protein